MTEIELLQDILYQLKMLGVICAGTPVIIFVVSLNKS